MTLSHGTENNHMLPSKWFLYNFPEDNMACRVWENRFTFWESFPPAVIRKHFYLKKLPMRGIRTATLAYRGGVGGRDHNHISCHVHDTISICSK